MKIKEKLIFHDVFKVSVILKCINGMLEFIGGLLLFFISSSFITNIIQAIFSHELVQDPDDILANFVINNLHNLSISAHYFVVFYLLANGLIKIVLSVALFKDKAWAFPLAAILLSVFIIYSIFRLMHIFSLILLALIILDVVILVLLRFEYKHYTKYKRSVAKLLP